MTLPHRDLLLVYLLARPGACFYAALNKLGHHYRTEIDDACFDGQVTITANPETPRLDLTPLGTVKAKKAAQQGASVERDILYGYVADATYGSRLSPTVSQRRAS